MKTNSIMVCKMAIVLLLVFSGPVHAQIRMEPAPPPKKVTSEEEKARQQTRWMNKNLDLQLEQYMKVNSINLTYAYRLDSLDRVAGNKHANVEYKAKMKETKEAELKNVLTADQYKQYQEHKEKPAVVKKSPFAAGSY